ncbi:MAG TPA: sulfite exporter TauE/SafE family protein [Chloroflexota bacterium]|nr:sulfite exporter TauE/SafE family protein [Chloroflexota bacterium]
MSLNDWASALNWGQLDLNGWLIALTVGIFTGIVSGLMGIGGGNIMVPASTILLRLGQHVAQGVSLIVIIPTAISGAWSHYKRGNVNMRVALLLTPGAVVGGLIGARVAQAIPGGQLRVIFGILLFYFAMRYLGVESWMMNRLRAPREAQRAAAAVPSPETAPPR